MKPINLITPHDLYLGLSPTPSTRAKQYSSMFESEIPDFKLHEIRHAVSRSKILGDELFKQQIEHQTGLALTPKPWGGNRRST
jgi:putative transposase